MSAEEAPALLRLAVSLGGRTWSDQALVDELTSGQSLDPSGQWTIWNWRSDSDLIQAPLEITVSAPPESDGSRDVLDAISQQLRRSFAMFCSERGWPEPGYRLIRTDSHDGEWSYQIALPSGPSATGALKPAKLLLVGEDVALAPFLGLETLDPVLNLPAKWIPRSQMASARAAGLHVFDSAGVVATHALHFLSEIWHRCLGFSEIQRWLLPALPEHAAMVGALPQQHLGLFLKSLKDLVAEQLWLPDPAKYLEIFLTTLSEFDAGNLDSDSLKELMRRDIVPLNLQRFTDHQGMLRAIEWRGEPDGEDADQSRLLTRLAEAVTQAHEQGHGGSPVVLTDFESRLELDRALSGPFPYLLVLSWAELPSHARVEVVAVVDARFEVDPSPWPYGRFEAGAIPQEARGE